MCTITTDDNDAYNSENNQVMMTTMRIRIGIRIRTASNMQKPSLRAYIHNKHAHATQAKTVSNMHMQTETRTGARGAWARIRETLTPMKPPAPHTSTVVPLPLPISIGIVSGRVFPWVQLRVTGQHAAAATTTPARSADKCLRHALRQRNPAQVSAPPRTHLGTRPRRPPRCPAAAHRLPPARTTTRPHARASATGRTAPPPPPGLQPRERHVQTLRGQHRRGGAVARRGGAARGAVAAPSGQSPCPVAAVRTSPAPPRPRRGSRTSSAAT